MQDALRLALLRSFEPLVRFALSKGLKIQDIVEVVKGSVVSAAQKELKAKDEKVNVSKLAVVTGLQRREVMRLERDDYSFKQEITLLTKLVGLWASGKRYQDSSGKIKKLTFSGLRNEFVSLCEAVSKDLNPYTVLFELERLGVVEKNGDKLVLQKHALTPDPASSEALELLADDLKDLCVCVTQNAEVGKGARNLHVKTYYDNIPPSVLPKLRAWLLHEGSKFHDKARKHLGQFDRDIIGKTDKEPGRAKIAIGSFGSAEVVEDEDKKNVENF